MADIAEMKVHIKPIFDRGTEGEFKRQLEDRMPRGRRGVSRAGGIGTGAFMGVVGAETLGKMAVNVGLMLGALYGIQTVLTKINESIKKIEEEMAQVNPILGGQFQLMDKMLNMTMLPITNVLVGLMKPYLSLQMFFLKKQLQESRGIVARAVTGDEGAMADLVQIFKDTYQDMTFLKRSFLYETSELTATVAGFTDGMKLDVGSMIKGFREYTFAYLEGLGKVTEVSDKFLETTSEFLTETDKASMDFYTGFARKMKFTVDSLGEISTDYFDKTEGKFTLGLSDMVTGMGKAISSFQINFSNALASLVGAVTGDSTEVTVMDVRTAVEQAKRDAQRKYYEDMAYGTTRTTTTTIPGGG